MKWLSIMAFFIVGNLLLIKLGRDFNRRVLFAAVVLLLAPQIFDCKATWASDDSIEHESVFQQTVQQTVQQTARRIARQTALEHLGTQESEYQTLAPKKPAPKILAPPNPANFEATKKRCKANYTRVISKYQRDFKTVNPAEELYRIGSVPIVTIDGKLFIDIEGQRQPLKLFSRPWFESSPEGNAFMYAGKKDLQGVNRWLNPFIWSHFELTDPSFWERLKETRYGKEIEKPQNVRQTWLSLARRMAQSRDEKIKRDGFAYFYFTKRYHALNDDDFVYLMTHIMKIEPSLGSLILEQLLGYEGNIEPLHCWFLSTEDYRVAQLIPYEKRIENHPETVWFLETLLAGPIGYFERFSIQKILCESGAKSWCSTIDDYLIANISQFDKHWNRCKGYAYLSKQHNPLATKALANAIISEDVSEVIECIGENLKKNNRCETQIVQAAIQNLLHKTHHPVTSSLYFGAYRSNWIIGYLTWAETCVADPDLRFDIRFNRDWYYYKHFRHAAPLL